MDFIKGSQDMTTLSKYKLTRSMQPPHFSKLHLYLAKRHLPNSMNHKRVWSRRSNDQSLRTTPSTAPKSTHRKNKIPTQTI